tara:strand:+ start:250 stop:669 length:420 start_codon:yes stop_codon:yes gene_type:complete
MIVSAIRKTMKTALKNFAALEEKNPKSIEVVIHTKTDEYVPEYFYMVDNQPKLNEAGEIKAITFTEMLGKKFDLMNREFLAAQFLPNWFKITSEEEKLEAKNMYIRIGTHSDDLSELSIELSNNGQKVKDLKLEDIFIE